jgi:tetratricopeptide (TPR) repeat protein
MTIISVTILAAVVIVAHLFVEKQNSWEDVVATYEAKGATNEKQLKEIAAAYPRSPPGLASWTEWALEQGEWQEAIKRSALFRERFPSNIYGYLAGARAMVAAKDYDGADLLMRRAIRVFPKEPRMWIDYASIAHNQRHLSEARARWQRVQKRFPKEAIGYVREGIVLVELGAYDEADAVLNRANKISPESSTIMPQRRDGLLWYAESAQRRGNWAEAASRWETYRTSFDGFTEGYIRGADALRRDGKLKEARNLITRGKFIFPKNVEVIEQFDILFNEITEKDNT